MQSKSSIHPEELEKTVLIRCVVEKHQQALRGHAGAEIEMKERVPGARQAALLLFQLALANLVEKKVQRF